MTPAFGRFRGRGLLIGLLVACATVACHNPVACGPETPLLISVHPRDTTVVEGSMFFARLVLQGCEGGRHLQGTVTYRSADPAVHSVLAPYGFAQVRALRPGATDVLMTAVTGATYSSHITVVPLYVPD